MGKFTPQIQTRVVRLSSPLYGGLLPVGMSIRNSSSKADAGGIESMRLGIQCWKGWSRKREKRRKAVGLIPIRCRRGSGGSENRVSGQAYDLPLARLASACVTLSGTRILGVK